MKLTSHIWIKTTLRAAARYRNPWLAARALLWVTATVPGTNHQQRSNGRVNRALILSFNKAGTQEDIKEVFSQDADFELIIWPSYALPTIANEILAPGLAHNRYVTNISAVEESKQQYRKYLRRVWEKYTSALNVDIVISVNFGYYVQRELAAALEEHGTPFIVLQKENFNGITPRRAQFWRKVYENGRGRFGGRKILVYNDIERNLQISSGVAAPDNVIVTGMPRLDRIHRWRKERARHSKEDNRSSVLFFGFSRREKIPNLFKRNKSRPYSAIHTPADLEAVESEWSDTRLDDLCVGTCEAITEFARRRPDVRVIVKTKARPDQSSDTLALLCKHGAMPTNIEFVTGGDPFELLTQSKVVVGFNTTGLIEAVAAGKPVIVPRFAEACQQSVIDFVLDLGEAVEYANSPEHLVELISRHVDQPLTTPWQLSENCAAMLRRLVGNDDGCAGRRILTVISREAAGGMHQR